eukprot:7044933-Prymnesium_polylepis.1
MWPSKAGLASAPQAAAKVADVEMVVTDAGSTSTPAKANPPNAEKKRKRATPMAERAAKAGVA